MKRAESEWNVLSWTPSRCVTWGTQKSGNRWSFQLICLHFSWTQETTATCATLFKIKRVTPGLLSPDDQIARWSSYFSASSTSSVELSYSLRISSIRSSSHVSSHLYVSAKRKHTQTLLQSAHGICCIKISFKLKSVLQLQHINPAYFTPPF